MHREPESITVSSEEYECEVMDLLKLVIEPHAQPDIQHRELLEASDGTYEIDIVVRFKKLGVDFIVLVECKHHKSPIKREVVQIHHDRIRSVGAHKGIIYSTSGFQKGAIEYAAKHGIALIKFIEGKSTYFTKAYGPMPEPPPWANIPKYSGWLIGLSENGGHTHSLVSRNHIECLRKFLLEKE